MAETLRFDVTGDTSGAQRSLKGLASTSDLAARGARILAESLEKERRAVDASARATLTLAKTQQILADAEDGAIAKTVEERIALDRLKHGLDEAAESHASLFRQLSSKSLIGGLFGGGGGEAAAAGGAGGIGKILATPEGAIGAIAAGLVALPGAAFAASGAITTILGGAITGLGVKFAAENKGVQKAWHELTKTMGMDLREISAPFVPVLKDIFTAAQGALPSIMLALGGAMKSIAGPFGEFAKTLVGAFGRPAFTKAIQDVGMAFGGILKALTPSLPHIIDGIGTAISNMAGVIERNPQLFADFFTGAGKALVFALQAVGNLGHAFTNMTHFVGRAVDAIAHSFRNFEHAFDDTRHAIAAIWDATWRDTIGKAQSAIADLIGWFRGIPGRAVAAMRGFGHSLASFASAAFGEMWSAVKNVAGDIWHWLTGWVQDLPGWLRHLLGIKSPSSVFYDIGKNMMLGLERGIKAHATGAADAARHAVSNAFAGAGTLGGDPAQNRRIALNLFPWPRTMWGAFENLVMAESGFNRFIRNPTSGAYGIPQALPESKMPFAAQAAGGSHAGAQLAWMFDYVRTTYQNPVNAWAHEQRFHWYGSGFHGWFDRPTVIGVGERGRERVDITPAHPAGGAGKTVLVINLPAGSDQLGRAFADYLRQAVRDQGGGSVQVALGTG